MKRFAMFLGALAVLSAASSNSWALIFQFDGQTDNTFLTAANWNEFVTNTNGVPGVGDRGIINANFAVAYNSAVTTTLGSLIVGGDWPVTGELGTDGTLNMTAGKIIVTGGGDNFQIARARGAVVGDANGDGLVTLTNAELQIGGSDPVVGTRDRGVLDVGLNGKVYNTPGIETYWRLGNYGPGVDAGLEGNGLLNVHSNGTFNAHVIFIGDGDATGELRVADTGSVVLTGNLVPRPSGFQAAGSATVRMIGSGATLSAFNLESESLAGEIATKYIFDADALGVSEIMLVDAINITNSALEVNLNGLVLPLFGAVTLFDGDQSLVTNRLFGTFGSVSVDGVSNPAGYAVNYNQLLGDIQLVRVPEPSAMALLGLGMALAISARRRIRS